MALDERDYMIERTRKRLELEDAVYHPRQFRFRRGQPHSNISYGDIFKLLLWCLIFSAMSYGLKLFYKMNISSGEVANNVCTSGQIQLADVHASTVEPEVVLVTYRIVNLCAWPAIVRLQVELQTSNPVNERQEFNALHGQLLAPNSSQQGFQSLISHSGAKSISMKVVQATGVAP